MHRVNVRSIIGSVAVAIAIGACGGGQIGQGVPAPAGSGGGASAALEAEGGATTAGTGPGKATCSQLTKADVQPLLADPITTVTVTAAGTDGDGQSCVFGTANSDGVIDVVVLGGSDAAPAYASDVQGLADPVDVPGIGDKAARDKGDNTDSIAALKGDAYCSVSGGGIPGVAALEQAAGYTSNIGDAAYATISAALGTLCNRIYGSGNTTPDLSSLTAAAPPSAP